MRGHHFVIVYSVKIFRQKGGAIFLQNMAFKSYNLEVNRANGKGCSFLTYLSLLITKILKTVALEWTPEEDVPSCFRQNWSLVQ